ncbi:hypothetical protein FDECE_903 [Fusarium decemcellulare]|nr:hypothetical protein FDECE_903 [Fusarium decemcellulare]
MAPPVTLFSLPYELREQIYHDYFKLEGGYVANANGKLTTSDGRPIDLSLMYTCRLIAVEAKDVPLMINTISFSTVYTPELSALAGRFEYLSTLHHLIQADILLRLVPFMTPDMWAKIDSKFPRFSARLRQISISQHIWKRLTRRPRDSLVLKDMITREGWNEVVVVGRWGQPSWVFEGHDTLSSVREAVRFSLSLVAPTQKRRFSRLFSRMVPTPGWGPLTFLPARTRSLEELLQLSFEPWAMPSSSDLERVGNQLQDEKVWHIVRGWHSDYIEPDLRPEDGARYRDKHRFSATAAAIRFLNHLSAEKRLVLRNLVLDEDHLAVGNPEIHALGLVPFCKENQRLRIERRISLWGNVFQKEQVDGTMLSARTWSDQDGVIYISKLPKLIAEWLIDGIAVLDAGMPPESFTLVLDGNPAPETTTEIFERAVHRNLAWASAFEPYADLIEAQIPADEAFWISRIKFGQNRFKEAITHLVNGTSILHCNFHPGDIWDIQKMVEERQNWDLLAHHYGWEVASEDETMDIGDALPNWPLLLQENIDREPDPAD